MVIGRGPCARGLFPRRFQSGYKGIKEFQEIVPGVRAWIASITHAVRKPACQGLLTIRLVQVGDAGTVVTPIPRAVTVLVVLVGVRQSLAVVTRVANLVPIPILLIRVRVIWTIVNVIRDAIRVRIPRCAAAGRGGR